MDHATIRRPPGLRGIETLCARYLRRRFKPHAHDEYILGVIESGVHAVWHGGEGHLVPGGSVVVMRPGDVHHGGAGDARGWSQRMIYIPEAAMREILADLGDRDSPPSPDFGAAFHARPDLARRFAALHETLHAAPEALARDVALDALMRAVLRELAPGLRSRATPSPEGRIDDAVEYLRSRVDEDVALEELCAVSGLRRRQTIAAFQRRTGLPPHAWHLQQKIRKTQGLLRAGMSAARAAAETGFADQSHMTRHFTAIVGVTPGAYARS
ncbi:AraC family transcriptional regulator [Neomegalonema sp.]|uniref:AraC family transcriptional regulator n=1 Tax=Neomegalonema sp. TaxID=2039713 RepID=UPI002623F2B8|nr:AraC family transcriptional regulator [Neomegalonema sp.]MDD2869724.1 AraC family transcriptional regulator [Neomegalonema sp.]